jgi:two-component system NtrC family sensor kinase
VVGGWFVWAVLHRPIQALMAGTKRVANGDLHYRIASTSKDELGELAQSFNKMTAELEEAHAEITAWAQQLEDRVERKSQELERAHKYLVGSEKMASIGKLAATVAHEVNNPLFGILTYARLSLKELDKPDIDAKARERMMEQLRIIERESRRCGDIIRNLLTYARQAPRKREANDINAIIDRAVALVRHKFKLQNIELDVSVADLPPVICDAGQVQQVALILLTNAAEATGEGGHITLSTERTEDGVRLIVTDDGGGIPPEVLPQIFDPFFTTKEDQLRTGLGLAVARSIVEQHAGTIQANSEPGRGAEFIVNLPLEAPASGESSAAIEASA